MILLVFAVVFGLLGLACAAHAVGSLGPYRRVLRQPTRTIGSLTAGPAEVAGTLRARGPTLTTLGGEPALAVRTTVAYSYRYGSKTAYTSLAFDETQAVALEIDDGSGAAVVDTTALLLLGVARRTSLTAADLQQRDRALWDRLPFPPDQQVTQVYVDQTFIPAGVVGLVSGEAEAVGPLPSDDYRSTKTGYRLIGAAERPLILSAFPEAQARWMLLRPTTTFAALAALAFAAAITLVGAAWTIGE